MLLAFATVGVACAGSTSPEADPSTVRSTEEAVDAAPSTDSSPNDSSPTAETIGDPTGAPPDIIVDALSDGTTIDRRLFGTNLPAWLGPERLSDPAFIESARASGTTLVRLPGGSWSNAYDWLGCEVGDAALCFWTWAARPTDFINFLRATDLEAMWTVSINHTAQSAAASVAFFNGEVGDTNVIGTDRDGVDWGTVDEWARLRSDGGNPEPIGIELWEIGNEVYGGSPDSAGDACASFGWEDVWTCDGTEYVIGNDDHDGYLEIRRAMLAVDDGLEVGAVGVGDPTGWNGWGNDVIEAAGDELDFYIVHEYGFDASPDPVDAVARPAAIWPQLLGTVGEALARAIPIAVTEYNLVAIESQDTEQSMTRAMNALYIADTLGHFATAGVPIANQWNLANGTTSSGTDYGLISADDGTVFPQFHALQMWSRAHAVLVPTIVNDSNLRFYATRPATNGTIPAEDWVIVAINLGADEVQTSLGLSGVDTELSGRIESRAAPDLNAVELVESSVDALSYDGGSVTFVLPAYSISVIELMPNG